MPDINFDCPHCGQNLDAPDDMVGMEIACPACEKTIRIPGAEDVEDPAAEEGVQGDVPEELKKSSTIRLQIPQNAMPPPPRKRIVRFKRIDK